MGRTCLGAVGCERVANLQQHQLVVAALQHGARNVECVLRPDRRPIPALHISSRLHCEAQAYLLACCSPRNTLTRADIPATWIRALQC